MVEVRHLTPRMNEVVYSAKTVVPPGDAGAVAIFDLGELLPQLKQTLQVTRITTCAAELKNHGPERGRRSFLRGILLLSSWRRTFASLRRPDAPASRASA